MIVCITHVKVGHRQAPYPDKALFSRALLFMTNVRQVGESELFRVSGAGAGRYRRMLEIKDLTRFSGAV